MQIDKKNYQIGSWFRIMSYGAFILCSVRSMLANIEIDTTIVTILMNLFILGGLNLTKIKKRVIIFILYALLTFVLFSSSILMPFNVLMLVYILRDEKINRLVYIYLIISLIFSIIVFFLLQFGILHSKTLLSHKGGMVNDLGFHNINSLALFEFNIICCFSILLRNIKSLFIFTLYIFAGVIVYNTTMSRTALIGIIGIVLGYFLYISNLIGRYASKIIAVIPLILTVTLFYIINNLENYTELSILSSGRLNIFSDRWQKLDSTHIITGMVLDPGPYDGGYFMLLFLGGLPWLLLFIFAFYLNINKYYVQYRSYIPFILGIILFSISESYIALATGMNIVFWSIILHTNGFVNNSVTKIKHYANNYSLS